MKEQTIQAAINNMVAASDVLRDALKSANAVEALVLLKLVSAVNQTRNDTENFLAAIQQTARKTS